MVARTPPKQKKIAAPLNPILLRETVKKVDQCMARLQELQYIVAGGTKVISGKSLSPGSTRCYLKTSLRCKQESVRIKNAAPRKSPVGKFAGNTREEWRRMSLPAMLVGETVGEILQASQFAREIVVTTATKKTSMDDPKTPVTQRRKQRPQPENTQLRARRNREKQVRLQSIRAESSDPPSLQRARSRINFKLVVSPKKGEFNKENYHLSANRVSPRNRPWARKTVMFPNPLFTPSRQQHNSCRTRSPVGPKTRGETPPQQRPHKFLIKSPPSGSKKSPVRIKNLPLSISPRRLATALAKKSPPKVSAAAKFRRSFSPSRLATRLASPLKNRKRIKNLPLSISPRRLATALAKKSPPKVSAAAKFRRSFSPSRLATRLVSPLKNRKSVYRRAIMD